MPGNHEFTFDVVQGGIVVLNEQNDRPGTIGFIGTSDGSDRWLVSCYHVLCRSNADPFNDGEGVFQGRSRAFGRLVATSDRARADRELDCAAAHVNEGINVSARVLGLPPLTSPIAPQKGMRVLKSGATTGVTEGEIWRVSTNEVEIRTPTGFATSYDLSGYGDSGALWVEAKTLSPVALHYGEKPGAVSTALGAPIQAVLQKLGLTLLR
jgi:hypothetical protein